MQVSNTAIQDCFLLTPKVFKDDRGYFLESFNKNTFEQLTGLNVNFVQDNESVSSYGTIRGLHFQRGEHAQAKLVRVVKGAVRDVVVDLRPQSPSFKKVLTVDLDDIKKQQLFVPRGCAHGFAVLSKTALFAYKCDNFYNKESEGGIFYNDPTLKIDWGLENLSLAVLSDKDLKLPRLQDLTSF